jgi:low temperature requirement protein LtrA
VKKPLTDTEKSNITALANVFIVAGTSVLAGLILGWRAAVAVWGLSLIISGLKGHSSVAP